MKKTSIIFAALIMLLCFAGCNQSDPVSNTNDTAVDTVVDKASDLRGSVSDNTYENKTFAISVDLSDEWYFYTDEEIAAAYNYSFDALEDDTKETFENADVIYDMITINPSTGNNINVNIENMGALYGAIYDEKKYLEVSVDTYYAVLEQMNATDIKSFISSATIAGAERPIAKYSFSNAGTMVYQASVCVKKDAYMLCITLTSYKEDKLDEMLSYLRAV